MAGIIGLAIGLGIGITFGLVVGFVFGYDARSDDLNHRK